MFLYVLGDVESEYYSGFIRLSQKVHKIGQNGLMNSVPFYANISKSMNWKVNRFRDIYETRQNSLW